MSKVARNHCLFCNTPWQSSYASTKKKRAHPYSLSCLLANIHDSWVLLFQHYTMICSAANIAGYMYVALASHLLESNVISSWHPRQAVSIHTVGDFYFFITNLQAVYRFINAGWFQFYHSFTYINVYFCKINFAELNSYENYLSLKFLSL